MFTILALCQQVSVHLEVVQHAMSQCSVPYDVPFVAGTAQIIKRWWLSPIRFFRLNQVHFGERPSIELLAADEKIGQARSFR